MLEKIINSHAIHCSSQDQRSTCLLLFAKEPRSFCNSLLKHSLLHIKRDLIINSGFLLTLYLNESKRSVYKLRINARANKSSQQKSHRTNTPYIKCFKE